MVASCIIYLETDQDMNYLRPCISPVKLFSCSSLVDYDRCKLLAQSILIFINSIYDSIYVS